MFPDSAEIGPELPSVAAATPSLNWMTTVPDACEDNVTFTTATTPLGLGMAFQPPDNASAEVARERLGGGRFNRTNCSADGNHAGQHDEVPL
jgi:hypothetical protein